MNLKALACMAAALLASGLAAAKPLRVLTYNLRYITSEDKGDKAWTARRDIYETALMQYESKQWSKACQTLVPLLDLGDKTSNEDITVRKLLQMSLECMGDAARHFDGVLESFGK